MKVLHIISDMRRGGRERQLALTASTPQNDFHHYVYAFHKVNNGFDKLYDFEINYPFTGGKLQRINDLIKICRKEKIDLIHAWGNSEYLFGVIPSLICSIPILNGSVLHGITLPKLSHRIRSLVLRRSRYIFANNYSGIKANRIKYNSDRHFVVYNGIDDKFFAKQKNNVREEFLIENKLPLDTLLLISVANFNSFKDYFTVLNSLSELKKEGYKFYYIVIGKGSLENVIKSKIDDLNMENDVKIFNNDPDIPRMLSISDLFIHSSMGEGCSNAILEAKAAGLTVVATDTGGTKEIIDENDFLFEYKNEGECISQIKKAINFIKLNPKMKNSISAAAKEKYSMDKFFIAYHKVLSEVVSDYHKR